jgi:hypothetical protein
MLLFHNAAVSGSKQKYEPDDRSCVGSAWTK